MITANKKIRSKYIKKERVRLNQLYRIAYNSDPRVKAHLEQEEQDKLKKKQEKYEKKNQAKLEELKLKEQKRLEEEEKENERKRQELQKKLDADMSQFKRKQNIESLKSLADQKLSKYNYEYDQFHVDDIVKKLNDEEIANLVKEVEDMQDTKEEFERVKAIMDNTKEDSIQRIKAQQHHEKVKEEKKKAKREWTKDEFALLAKALNKYPGGTVERWKSIAEFMGEQYTAKDVIDMAKSLNDRKNLNTGGKAVIKGSEQIIRSKGGRKEDAEEKKEKLAEEDWTDEQQKSLELALKKFPKTLSPKSRWGGIAKTVGNKTPKE